ncbi:MAG TPA: ABC transporter permease, partial [Chitinophagaceae bacterium]|nr:ABC transporter permease [Chitinophagaceae bacterium]
LFRVTCEVIDKKIGRDQIYGEAAAVQGPAFKDGIPEIEDFVRTYEANFLARSTGEIFDQKALWVDKNFFKIFSFPLAYGNSETVLTDPHSIVLTERLAKKYFGTVNAIGRVLELEIDKKFEPFIVSGIAKKPPENSSIKFDILIPFTYYADLSKNDHGDWHLLNYSTYLLLRPHSDPVAVRTKMKEIYKKTAGEQLAEANGLGLKFIWGLQPFLKMHLDTETVNEGSIKDESKPIYSYILTCIAFFILLIACINFINLTIAQSLRRSKEIGLRKTIGGSRLQLILQFLGESFVFCFIAFALAVLLTSSLLPLFNGLANKQLSLEYLFDPVLLASFAMLFLFTGFAAGFYPALVLSGFRPAASLQNRVYIGGKDYLSRVLVVVQFAMAAFLIIATAFIYFQYHYLTHANLGYNDKNLVVVNISGEEKNRPLLNLFKSQFSSVPGVEQVAEKMDGRWTTSARAEGKEMHVDYDAIDENYLSVLQVPIIQGRNFSKNFPSDSSRSVLINETFVKEIGWKNPIGKTVDMVNGKETRLTIIGIVKDYHFASLKNKIMPKLLTMDPKMDLGRFVIRMKPGTASATLKGIENIYRNLFPFHPFNYYFVEEENLRNYEAENKWKQIIMYSAILTIFISAIGLFGLTTLSIRKRTKEIGVRKVLGANTWQISLLVTRDFFSLVLMALLLAIPGAWIAVSHWLENFPYRIQMNVWIVVMACVFTLLIALLTVSLQALKAGNANPVKNLRTE